MEPQKALLEIFKAGLAAVAPDKALNKYLKRIGDELIVAGEKYDLNNRKIRVVGGGKGAAPMARALEQILDDKIDEGVIVVKYDHGLDLDKIKLFEAAHPVPDANGQKGAEECLAIAAKSAPDDLVICLLTGGASSLLPAPAAGLTLDDLRAVTSALLASGVNIEELNIIRRHLSRLAGGRLAAAGNGANVLSLIVSDVVGDALDAIASGPTAPDNSTFADSLAIIAKYNLADKIPPRALEFLKQGAAGKTPETPNDKTEFFQRVRNVIVAGNAQAIDACALKARELGFVTEIWPEQVIGDANAAARALIARAKQIQQVTKPGDKPRALIAGGETTVVIKGEGLGGRNQQMALVANLELEETQNIYALFAGTDGTDGPTDAAGGFADSSGVNKMGGREAALAWLGNNDSYNALDKANYLLKTGPTLSNVMDLAIILVFSPNV